MPFLDEDGVTRLTEDYLDIFAPKEELGEGDGTNAGPIYELSAKGHAEQASTTGKNLWLCSLAYLKSANTDGTWSGSSYVYNGITMTYNADGSIKFTGSASADILFRLGRRTDLVAGSTYTASGIPSGHSVRIANPSWTSILDGTTFTAVESNTTEIRFTVSNGTEFSTAGITFYPQLELGSEATEYEPYTGGAPSPSPDYPQEIQVVRGRNLFDKDNASILNAYINNGTIRSNASNRTVVIPVKPSMTYTLQGSFVAISSSNDDYQFAQYASEPTDGSACISGTFSSATSRSLSTTFTTEPTANYIAVKIANTTKTDPVASLATLQLTLGSTPQPYVPYGHVGMEVQGKNLWGGERMADDIIVGINNSSLTSKGSDSHGKYVSWPVGAAANDKLFTSAPFKESTQYTLVIVVSSSNVNRYIMHIKYMDGSVTAVVIPSPYTAGSIVKFTVTTEPEKTVKGIYGAYYSGYATLYYDECGLFEGIHTVDEFEPYYHTTTPIPLPDRGWVGGLPDGTSDILTLDGAGKCEWELNDEEVVLDGSIACDYGSASTSHTDTWRARFAAITGMTAYNARSSHFTSGSTATWANMGVGQFYLDNSGIILGLPVATIDTAEKATAWLQSNPITVLYPLATPVTEDMGYIEDWPTDIPEGATITIPELDALNVKYFVANDSISQYAEQWYERTKAVDIAQVEDAIGDLASVTANLVTHDLFYFGYDEVNGKKMISIFKRGDI